MRLLLFISMLCYCLSVFAQQDTAVTFDRPGVADSPYLIPKKSFQLESGFTYLTGNEILALAYPAVMARIRVANKYEVRLNVNYEPPSFSMSDYNNVKNFTGYSIGVKRKLWREKAGMPETAVMYNLVASANHRNLKLPVASYSELYFLFQNNFKNWLGINYNLAIILPHAAVGSPLLHYSLCFNFNIAEKITLFAEHYFYKWINSTTEYNIDAGLMWLVHPKLQLDIAYGVGFVKSNYKQFAALGISWCIKKG